MPAQSTPPESGAAPTPDAATTTAPVPVAAPWWQQWVTPLVILGALTLFLNQQNRAFDAVNKRIDVLREDVKEIRQDVKTLLLQQAAKQPVTPDR